jgi:hypothetical protein
MDPRARVARTRKTTILSESDIPLIFGLAGMGLTDRDIAEKFEVKRGTISHVMGRRTWASVHIDPDVILKSRQARISYQNSGRWGK